MVDTVAPTGADTKDPSIAPTTPPNDVSELLRVMEINVKAITRMTAALTKLSERLDETEKRLTVLEGEGVTDEMGEPAPTSSKRVVRREGST
jgi:hypothetical protein